MHEESLFHIHRLTILTGLSIFQEVSDRPFIAEASYKPLIKTYWIFGKAIMGGSFLRRLRFFFLPVSVRQWSVIISLSTAVFT